jgi:hypothetical protein
MAARQRFRRRLGWTAVGLFSVYVISAVALTTWKLEGPLIQPYCSERPPFATPLCPRQAVFTAKALYVGRIDRDDAARSGRTVGHWALASVEHQYWGLPWWSSTLVFLADGRFEEGREYFVDGDRSSLVSHLVPLVHIGTCTRSAPLKSAQIDLRILRDGPPKSGVRIVGRVVRQALGQSTEPAPGIKVQITGPLGPMFVMSDEQGVYDASGLPPGRYSLTVGSAGPDYLASLPLQRDLKAGDVWGRTLLAK